MVVRKNPGDFSTWWGASGYLSTWWRWDASGYLCLHGRTSQYKHNHALEISHSPLLSEKFLQMLQLRGSFRSINHLWNSGRDRGMSLVDNTFILLLVSDKGSFCRSSFIPSHHLFFLPPFFILVFIPGCQYFFFIPQWNSPVALPALLSLQVQKWFTGEAITAHISLLICSLCSLPSCSERGSMTQLPAKRASSFQ